MEETDFAALYRFIPEWERKKARLIEALPVAPDRGKEIDKALKEWTRQIGWFAVEAVDKGTLKAFEDAGVTHLMWHSEHDNRVCNVCYKRDKVIYKIDELPTKHINCRCWLTIAEAKDKEWFLAGDRLK